MNHVSARRRPVSHLIGVYVHLIYFFILYTVNGGKKLLVKVIAQVNN